MMKIDVNRGNVNVLKAQGDVFDIVADMAVVIRAIYHVLSKNDEDIGDAFRDCLTALVNEEKSLFEPFEENEDESQQ